MDADVEAGEAHRLAESRVALPSSATITGAVSSPIPKWREVSARQPA